MRSEKRNISQLGKLLVSDLGGVCTVGRRPSPLRPSQRLALRPWRGSCAAAITGRGWQRSIRLAAGAGKLTIAQGMEQGFVPLPRWDN